MKKAWVMAYALVAYAAFLGSFAALVLASTGLAPALVRGVDGDARRSAPEALAIDLALVLAFGVQHTVMARAGFKRALTRVVPAEIERSTFVLASAALVAAIALAWEPLGGALWSASAPGVARAVQGVALAGYGLVVVASFALDHFALFGLTRAVPAAFRVPALYRVVRHPMMLGMLVGVWAAPRMTVGHAVFAASMTAYIVVGVHFEERSLLRELGDAYARYRAEVPMLLPWPRPSRARAGSAPRAAS